MSSAPEESSPLKETRSDPFSKPRWLRQLDGFCIIVTTMVVFSVAVTIALVIEVTTGAKQIIPHGAVISNNADCTKLGIEMLELSDASTADAAVFTALCLCVAHPHAASIGGGGFSLVHNQRVAEKETHFFNFREMSPSILSNETVARTKFYGKGVEEIPAADTVAVPGMIKGLYEIHKQHGKVAWKTILKKVIKLAEDGVQVSNDLAQAIDKLNLTSVPEDTRKLVTKNGTKLQQGDVLVQPELAETLKLIADEGNYLYSQKGASEFVKLNQTLITAQDLINYNISDDYKVDISKYKNMKVITAKRPTFGPVLNAVVSTLSFYNQNVSNDQERYLQMHRLVESLKFGFSRIGQNTTKWNNTSSDSVGAQIAAKINDTHAYELSHYLDGLEPIQISSEGQQFVAVSGPDGIIINIAMSIGSEFGSKLMTLGFVLNNAVLDFSWPGKKPEQGSGLKISQENLLTGNKRPLSSLVPLAVVPAKSKCGTYTVPLALPGYVSVSAIAQYIMAPSSPQTNQASLQKPRIHQQLVPNVVEVEATESQGLITYLRDLGHEVVQLNGTLGKLSLLVWKSSQVMTWMDAARNSSVSKGQAF